MTNDNHSLKSCNIELFFWFIGGDRNLLPLPSTSPNESLHVYCPVLEKSTCCNTFWVGLAIELLPGHPGFVRQGLQVVPGLQVDDAVQIFLRWRAKDACTERRVRDFFLMWPLDSVWRADTTVRSMEVELSKHWITGGKNTVKLISTRSSNWLRLKVMKSWPHSHNTE